MSKLHMGGVTSEEERNTEHPKGTAQRARRGLRALSHLHASTQVQRKRAKPMPDVLPNRKPVHMTPRKQSATRRDIRIK